jgi:putative phage-type endonuclease
MTNKRVFTTFAPEQFNDARLLGVFEDGSEEWLEARTEGVGGSQIGTICGLNPWESAFALWAKRTGQIPDPELTGWSIRFGKAFEDPILGLWADEHPEFEVFKTGTYVDAAGVLIANPDGLAKHRESGEWVVVEVKTSRASWREVPPHYNAQVQHYMDVLGVGRACLVGVVGWDWHETWIEFDEFQAQSQRAAATRFMAYLRDVKRPDWDGSKATYEAVRYMHPEIEDDSVDIGELGEQLLFAHEAAASAEIKLNKVKSMVLDRMGSAKYGYVVDHQDERVVVAQRQARGNGTPWLVVKGRK